MANVSSCSFLDSIKYTPSSFLTAFRQYLPTRCKCSSDFAALPMQSRYAAPTSPFANVTNTTVTATDTVFRIWLWSEAESQLASLSQLPSVRREYSRRVWLTSDCPRRCGDHSSKPLAHDAMQSLFRLGCSDSGIAKVSDGERHCSSEWTVLPWCISGTTADGCNSPQMLCRRPTQSSYSQPL